MLKNKHFWAKYTKPTKRLFDGAGIEENVIGISSEELHSYIIIDSRSNDKQNKKEQRNKWGNRRYGEAYDWT